MRTAETARPQTICLLSAHPMVLRQLEQVLSKAEFRLRKKQIEPLFNPMSPGVTVPRAAVYVIDCESPRNIEAIVKWLATRYPHARLLIVASSFSDELAFPLLRLGVKGLVTHEQLDEELPHAVRAVAGGACWVSRVVLSRFVESLLKRSRPQPPANAIVGLSRRQKDVISGVLENLSNKEIAQNLNISERTVKFHVSALLEKFGVRRRADLILVCYQEGQGLLGLTAEHLPQAGTVK